MRNGIVCNVAQNTMNMPHICKYIYIYYKLNIYIYILYIFKYIYIYIIICINVNICVYGYMKKLSYMYISEHNM